MTPTADIHLSIVSPVYGCAACLADLVREVEAAMEAISCTSYEVILVNDASPDGAWEVIAGLAQTHPAVTGIQLSRNFGQHAAIQAGLARARGQWVVVMDCDLQDRPDQIPALYRRALEGADLVLARRAVRQDQWLKRKSSQVYYRLLSYLTGTRIDPAVANFGIYHRKVVGAIHDLGDYVRFFPSMAAWVGFEKAYVDITHNAREEGKSSYSFGSLIRLGLNVVLSFSDKPLRITVKFGFLVTSIALLVGIINLVMYFNGNIAVLGYTSLILSIWFLSGIIISILGIVGLYLGKTFDQVKGRPVYIVSETTDGRAH